MSDTINFKKSTLEMEKLLLYLTCALEKGKALSAENKILKKRIRTLLRKSGRLNIRVNVKWNSNVRKYQMSLSDDCKLTQAIVNEAKRHLPMEMEHEETTAMDQGIPKENEVARNIQSRGSSAMVDAATQFEGQNVNGRVLKRKRFSEMDTSLIRVAYKRPQDTSRPSRIPVPNFQTLSRPALSDCSPKNGAPLSNESSAEKLDIKRTPLSILTMESLHQRGLGTEKDTSANLLYLPSLMATVVSKTAESVKGNLDVSWSSLCQNSYADEQFNELFGEREDIMPLVVALSGIHHCSRRIFGRISGLVDSKGNTLLHLVAQNDKYGMLPVILEHNSESIDARNYEGQTALMLAAISGCATGVRLLLDTGAAPNAHDRKGRTALMEAVRGRHEQVVRLLLLQRGISIFIKDTNGVSAVDLAIQSNSEDIQCCFLMNSQMYT